ncbi:MAG: TolC family protein [Acidimicrobiia bacterium]|nr:TolC family protein [Acidimicrobiia bacterium]
MRVVFFLFTAAIAFAQAPPRVGVGITETKLTLHQALESALKSNLEIEIQRTTLATANEAAKAARGAFDPLFRWQPSLESRTIPTASPLLGAEGKLVERVAVQNVQISQRLPWHGATLVAGFDNSRQSTTNPFSGLTPFYNSRLLLQFQQPLLRNRKTDASRAEIQIRSRNTDISRTELELKVIDVVTRTETAYWDLVAARQDVEVKADGMQWAREQLDRTRRMIESGTLAAVELAAAEAELERRADSFHAAVGTLTEVENGLKLLIASERSQDIWTDAIVPVEERTAGTTGAEELAEATRLALGKRPELRQLDLLDQNNGTQKKLASDQMKPQLNLVGSYINSGLAGAVQPTENPFAESSLATAARLNELSRLNGLAPLSPVNFGGVPPGLLGGYGSALSNLFGGSFPAVQLGVSMEWNMRNRTAESTLSQAVISERRLRLQRTQLEQVIAAQVRNSLQALATARQRIIAAEASARAAQEKLDSEVRLFQNGESTNFLVLTRQNELSDSRRRVVVSRLEFNKAVARLRQASGTTLEAHSLQVP